MLIFYLSKDFPDILCFLIFVLLACYQSILIDIPAFQGIFNIDCR